MDELSNTHYLQRKYDGCNGILIVTPNGEGDKLLSRTGEVIKSCQHLIAAMRHKLSRLLEKGYGYAVLGEVWHPAMEFEQISGKFRQHRPAPDLMFVVCDMLYLQEFESGQCDRRFDARYLSTHIWFKNAHATDPIQLAATYLPGSYGRPAALATQWVADGGYDGGILRDPNGTWKAGNGTDGEIIKVKAAVTYDLRVLDVEEGKGKYKGTLGALVCQGPVGTVKVSGMTDEQRAAWWANSSQIVGQIIEVQCLGLTGTGSLREPRFKGVRFDKEGADFE